MIICGDLKKIAKDHTLKSSMEKSHVDDDFKAYFHDFNDNYDEDEGEDIKPLSPSPNRLFLLGLVLMAFVVCGKWVLLFFLVGLLERLPKRALKYPSDGFSL